MAPILYHLVVAVIALVLILSSPFHASSSHNHHHSHGLKSLHLSLFQHETINKTAYIIVNGVTGPRTSKTTSPFGTLVAFDDPLTVAPNLSSKAVGTAQGTSITASLDGLETITVAKVTLHLKNHVGSISIVGCTHNVKPTDHPVVGGTGDFLFVQGYVTSSLVNFKGMTATYKIKFHLYCPPYAT